MTHRAAALTALQRDMDLAAIELEEHAVLITMAGAQGIHAFELADPAAVAIVWEPLDPAVAPSRLRRGRALDLERGWEANEFLTGALVPLSDEQARDLAAAGAWSWVRGDAEALAAAPSRWLLRIESWQLEPERADLCVAVGAAALHVHDEDGEIALAAEEAAPLPAPSRGHAAPPPAPPFEVGVGDAPEDLIAPVRAFFELHHAGRWRELARVHPRIDDDEERRAAWLAAHFIDIHEWGYARAIGGWWREGDLACVGVRGIQFCLEEDSMEAHAVECVWSFSLRRCGGEGPERWVVRHWTQAWPGAGGAPELPLADKPWLSAWEGPVE